MDSNNDILECRTCLSTISIKDSVSLFIKNETNIDYTYAELLMECSSVHIEKNDFLPQYICNECKVKLQISYKFKKLCESSDEFLRVNINLKIRNLHYNVNSQDLKDANVEFDSNEEHNNKNSIKDEKKTRSSLNTICHACNIDMKNFRVLRKHVKESHRGEVTCQICQKTFTEYRKLYKHSYLHKNKKSFQCSKCVNSFPNLTSLNNHIIIDCPKKINLENKQNDSDLIDSSINLENQKINCDLNKDKYKRSSMCAACQIEFQTCNELDKHVKLDHPGQVECVQCNRLLDNYKSLKKHIANNHKIKDSKINTIQICPYCERNYSNIRYLKSHIAFFHLKNDPILDKYRKTFLCTDCGKKFKHQSNFKNHVRLHTGEKPYKCEQCSKSFIQSSQFKAHLSSHTTEKKYACDICKKKFLHRSYIYQHKLIHHKKLRKFQCEICDSKYFTKYRLTLHNDSVHLGIKQKCKYCDKQFAYLRGLKVHEKKHKDVIFV